MIYLFLHFFFAMYVNCMMYGLYDARSSRRRPVVSKAIVNIYTNLFLWWAGRLPVEIMS